MPCVFFLFWGGILAFFGGGLLASDSGWAAGLRRKSRAATWLFGTVFASFAATILVGLISWGYGIWLSEQPAYVFEQAFHENPGANIQLLHAHASSFIDSAGITLSFQTDRGTFDRLRPEKLRQATLEEYRYAHVYFEKWWRHPTEATEIWIKRPRSADDSDAIIMTWDADGIVQYDWSSLQ